jgi:choloylglycine hydrolase
MRRRFTCGLLLVAMAAPVRPAASCTTFCFEDGHTMVFGKNYDWNVEDGIVVANPRGMRKTALFASNPARWTSTYASITFNQYGREFPSGGINERGLVVELMWLEATEYPAEDERAGLPTLQWIQYQLDTADEVEDVIASDASVRITDVGSAKIHFLVADAGGDVAAIEFLSGRMVVHRGEDLPYPVLTNHTYEESAAHARAAGPKTGASSGSSLDRFARAAGHERTAGNPSDAVRNAFALLDDVAQGEYTQWSIVYDLRERRVHFRTRLSREVRWLDVDDVSAGCAVVVSMIDVNAPHSGDVSEALSPYSYKTNFRLVNAAFDKTEFLRAVPPVMREVLAHYPESTVCAEGDGPPGTPADGRGSEQ